MGSMNTYMSIFLTNKLQRKSLKVPKCENFHCMDFFIFTP
jgi:hypothetical protein